MENAVSLFAIYSDSKAARMRASIRTWIREQASCTESCPVVIVEGAMPPKTAGEGFYFTNGRGDIIHSPNAYRRAWGKPIYHPSTYRVEVGSEWLAARGLKTVDVLD